MRVTISIVGAIAALLLGQPAHAAEAASSYLLAMELRDSGRLVGTPALQVRSGEPATIEIDDGAGHRYALRVTATPQDAGTVFVQSSVEVTSGDAHYAATPALVVKLGRSSTIQLGTTAQPFRIDFTVTAAAAD
jgi:hypothetical protein